MSQSNVHGGLSDHPRITSSHTASRHVILGNDRPSLSFVSTLLNFDWWKE